MSNRSCKINAGMLTAFLIALAPTVAAAANELSSSERAERRQQIAGMSQTERDRLTRSYDRFQSLTADQRQQYRRLHEEVEQNAAEGGSLKRVLYAYNRWLRELTPWQREAILAETDTVKRLELIRRFRQSSPRTGPDSAQPGTADDMPSLAGRPHRRHVPPLSPDDIVTVTEVALRQIELPDEINESASQLDAVGRSLVILAWIYSPEAAAAGIDKSWPGTEIVDRMIAALPGRRRDELESTDNVERRRQQFLEMLGRGIAIEWHHLVHDRIPDRGEMRSLITTLPEEDRRELLQLHTHDAIQDFLTTHYFLSNGDSTEQSLASLRERFADRVDWGTASFPPPHGGRFGPPGGGRDGRPPDGDFGRPRRPPPGNRPRDNGPPRRNSPF